MLDKIKEYFDEVPSEWKSGIAIALIIIVLFVSGNIIGLATTAEEKIAEGVDEYNSQVQEEPSSSEASATTQPAVTQPPVTQAPVTPDAPVDTPLISTVPSTPAEIIALFNESANKVKTNATTVVKNYEKRTVMDDKLIIPGGLEDMAAEMMAKYMSDDLEPITYATKEDIIANYQVPGQTWVSQLTEAEVMEATCTDNGTEYEVMIKLHPSTNPEPGNGVAKAFDTITSSEIMSSAPSMVTGFNTEYFDCVVRCKIDKTTGNMISANYTSPVVLKLSIKMIVALDAQIGMSFEKDYTISY